MILPAVQRYRGKDVTVNQFISPRLLVLVASLFSTTVGGCALFEPEPITAAAPVREPARQAVRTWKAQPIVQTTAGPCVEGADCVARLKRLVTASDRSWIGQPEKPASFADGTRLFAYRALRPKLTCRELALAEADVKTSTALMRQSASNVPSGLAQKTAALAGEVAAELGREREDRCRTFGVVGCGRHAPDGYIPNRSSAGYSPCECATLQSRPPAGGKTVRAILSSVLLLSLVLLAAPAGAQTYPDRTVKIIVPQPPGGGFDTVARILADRLGACWARASWSRTASGAGTLVGTEAAAKAPADGYTLLLGGLSNIALNPGLYAKLPYDPLKDFTPIGLAVTWSYTLVARKDLPYKDLKELIAFARANPEKITFASAGKGSGQHIAMAVTAQLAGVKLTHVAYKGAQAAYQDILGGRVDLFFDISSTARAQVDAARCARSPSPRATARRCIPTCRA